MTPGGTGPEEDLRFMLSQLQEIIRYADTKLSFLLTAMSFVIGQILDGGIALVSWADGVRTATGLLGAAGLVLLAASVLTSLFGVMPRTWRSGPVNRFAWPSLAGMSGDDLLTVVRDEAGARTDAAAQIVTLARIARWKFELFRWAAMCAVGGVLLLVGTSLMA